VRNFNCLVWLPLLCSFLIGCRADLHPIPANADPEEREAVARLKPLAENLAWDEDGNVWIIDLAGAKIKPPVLNAILDLKELNELNLRGSDIQDHQLAKLKHLANLGSLGLQWTSVTDEAVVHLISIRSLKCLDLSHTEITDRGLELLATKEDLTHVFLTGTPTSKEAIAEVRQMLPECHIQK